MFSPKKKERGRSNDFLLSLSMFSSLMRLSGLVSVTRVEPAASDSIEVPKDTKRLFVIVVMPLIDTQFPPLLPQRSAQFDILLPFPLSGIPRASGRPDIASR